MTSGCASWGSVLHEDSCPVVPMLGSDPLSPQTPISPPQLVPAVWEKNGFAFLTNSFLQGKEQLLLSPSPEMSPPPPLLLSRTFIAGWEIENKRSKLLSV